ncbi:MAG TPA: ATP-binding protein [Waterburya sp.]
MEFPSRLRQETGKIWQRIDLHSLRVRLTLGMVTVSAIGVGSVAVWTSWKMQHLLITTHKQNIQDVADRFSHDVEIYSHMMPVQTGMQKAIHTLTTGNTLLWMKRTDGTIISESTTLEVNESSSLLTLNQQLIPQIYQVNNRYWVMCGTPVRVKGAMLGKVYVAKDITNDQMMFLSLIRTLGIASVLSLGIITVVIACYIRRSLEPLRRISQLTQTISADDLGQARIQLDRAPSEVRELAQTFDKMLVRLFEAWEQQRQFVSNVSHELRTPLSIVSGYLQSTLRRGDNLTQPQREALSIAASEADRTIQLLQDLLDLARADSGRMHFNLEPLILNDVVTDVVGMAEGYSNRAIHVEQASRLIEVRADRDRLKQVLLNLIDNAVKYSEPDQPVTVKLEQVGEQATIQVCDKGKGIPLAQQTRIFERFYRVDEARARSTGGCGLGLSIVKTLVEGMGGRVTLRSQLGEGSVFTVTLPTQLFQSLLT